MMASLWISCGIFLLAACLPLSMAQKCNVDDITVQEDFDLEAYMGKWYELEWKPAYFENYTDYYTDYYEDYWLTDDGMDGSLVGRSGEVCIHGTRVFHSTDTPGKLNYTAIAHGTEYAMDYWVISTDYSDYSLVWGCTKQTDGLCDEMHMWVFGRGTTITEESWDTVRDLYEELCVDEDTIVVTSHDDECEEPKKTGTGVREQLSVSLLYTAFVITLGYKLY